jgi:hypothetical protein
MLDRLRGAAADRCCERAVLPGHVLKIKKKFEENRDGV